MNFEDSIEISPIDQVVHDLMSPLTGLEALYGQAKGLSQGEREILRLCIRRIHDLADELPQKLKKQESKSLHLRNPTESSMEPGQSLKKQL